MSSEGKLRSHVISFGMSFFVRLSNQWQQRDRSSIGKLTVQVSRTLS